MNIIICKTCQGSGEVSEVNHEWRLFHKPCHRCNGTGRLKEKTYTLSVPFDYEDSKFHKIDEKIFEVLRTKND